ncbi:hypothetical protein H681_00080 [Pseudomonas sp. ATCC 13867]|uniref:hypothetical protein n=1 Tax=Pseudomonas sp. ATCC 13867 TaxID=1294143 RepID=UPI0002C4DE97|nr:hypothetical protein [Pseudomonas sp. ATCC 13867]AGI21898.1 hypothetical protein H681_00080 [Pseudomonas sp. ATCC 13867]RFQ19791.1 hypothetical protein D0N87_24945 [Pseudomonas sp. ATCC 13867]
MGRRANTAWFSQYRVASAELPTALAKGERQADVLLRHAQSAGVKNATFARMMKAGRALDDLRPNLGLEEVGCTYMQADMLGKIAQISPARAQTLLPDVLRNQCSLEQLNSLLGELQEAEPQKAVLHNRDSTRRLLLAHERSSADAIARVGAKFFGYPEGRILQQAGATLYQAPNMLVTQDGVAQVALFIRVGSIAKPAMAVGLEYLQLALAHRALVPRICFVLPQDSPIISALTRLITQVEAAPYQGDWLNLAMLDPANGQLSMQSEDTYQTLAAMAVFDDDAADLRWAGRDLVSGEAANLNYFAALQR